MVLLIISIVCLPLSPTNLLRASADEGAGIASIYSSDIGSETASGQVARSAIASRFSAWRRLGLLGHGRELRPVGPDVGHLMRDDQMMRGVHGDLDVIAHDT